MSPPSCTDPTLETRRGRAALFNGLDRRVARRRQMDRDRSALRLRRDLLLSDDSACAGDSDTGSGRRF